MFNRFLGTGCRPAWVTKRFRMAHPVSGNLASIRGWQWRAQQWSGKGEKGGSDEERGWLKRTDLPTGRMFYERKIENVVLRDVVTEAAKQINPVKRQAGRRGR